MSIPNERFWGGSHDDNGMPDGRGTMTTFCSVTGVITNVEQRWMSHGLTEQSVVLDLPADEALHPDVTATVAHVVDNDWLFSEDGPERGRKAKKATKAKAAKPAKPAKKKVKPSPPSPPLAAVIPRWPGRRALVAQLALAHCPPHCFLLARVVADTESSSNAPFMHASRSYRKPGARPTRRPRRFSQQTAALACTKPPAATAGLKIASSTGRLSPCST